MLVSLLDRLAYPCCENQTCAWDVHWYYRLVKKHLSDEDKLLDYGAGRGAIGLLDFRRHCRSVTGVDVDPVVLQNPHLNDAALIENGKIPADDRSVDVVICHNVIEHLSSPASFFEESQRVLRSGGKLIIKTPNKWHYSMLAARWTPFMFHRWYNRLRGRPTHDTFPTYYRCNSVNQIRTKATSFGFRVISMEVWEWRPEYLRINAIPYLFGIAYERFVNLLRLTPWLGCTVVAVLQSETAAETDSDEYWDRQW